ncbi:hypothetical protein SLA2020_232460 [Shorea laevis]
MDVWPEKMLREGRSRDRKENPSFSATLLDAIYRSIDEPSGGKGEKEVIFYRETMRKKVSSEKAAAGRRKSMADFDAGILNLSSSSSDSSSGGGFSSSESDSFYGVKSRSSSYTAGYTAQRPKPIRTSVSGWNERYVPPQFETQKPKHEGGLNRTKSKALKIYSDLKKVKQPTSPGGRLASFLNSLFTTGNAKKAKISSSVYEEGKTPSSSTCSSASSFSRSCLSKTPSSRGNGAKRSVRFWPVSTIVDEDCRPCGEKSLHETEQSTVTTSRNRDLELRIMEENRRVVEAAKDLLKNYQKKKEEFDMRKLSNNVNEGESSDEEDEDDAASYASSDLFELDNLSVIGVERYHEELPVYETTHLDTNRAIANGLIV